MAETETVRVIHVANDRSVLAVRDYGGSRAAVTLPVRHIIADALALQTASLVISHNHPSDDVTPSLADRRATAQLCQVANALGICLHDHLIIGDDSVTSFRALGWL